MSSLLGSCRRGTPRDAESRALAGPTPSSRRGGSLALTVRGGIRAPTSRPVALAGCRLHPEGSGAPSASFYSGIAAAL